MCVITGTLAAIGTGIVGAASATASAATAAASAIGSAIATGASAVGAGLSATGSAIASGASAVGSATMSGLSAASSAVAGTVDSALAATTAGAADIIGTEGALTGSNLAAAQLAGGMTDVAGAGVQAGAAMGSAGVAGSSLASEAAAATAGLTTAEKIALGVGLASGAATGVTQLVQSRDEADALRRQAKYENIKAGLEQEAGQREAIDAARKARQERGTGIAQMAMNGVMVDDAREGSVPTMYESDLAAELAYDQSKIMHNAELRAWGYRSNAADLRRRARSRTRTGYASAGLSFLTAGLSAYGGTKTLLS